MLTFKASSLLPCTAGGVRLAPHRNLRVARPQKPAPRLVARAYDSPNSANTWPSTSSPPPPNESQPAESWISWLWPGQGKKRRVAALFGAALMEWWLTGVLFWTPSVCVALLIMAAPALDALLKAQAARQEEAVAQAVRHAQKEMAKQVQASPVESAQWMNLFLNGLWMSFVQPMILKAETTAWQSKLLGAAPAGWDLELVQVELGSDAPTLSNFKAFNNPQIGAVSALECDILFNSQDLKVKVKGTGPLGSFTAIVSQLTVKGTLKFQPFPTENVVLFAFTEKPEAALKLAVKGPVIGERDIPQFSFIKEAFVAALEDSVVEPRRTAISLDAEYLVQQAVDTVVNINVESVSGLNAVIIKTTPKVKALMAPGASANSNGAGLSHYSHASHDFNSSGSFSSSRYGDSLSSGSYDALVSGSYNDGTMYSHSLDANALASGSFNAAAAVAAVAAKDGAVAMANGKKGKPPRAKVQVQATNTLTKVQRSTMSRPMKGQNARVQQLLKIGLGSKDGSIRLTVVDPARSGAPLGSALLNVMAAKDGTTLFWANGENGEAVVKRWQPSAEPYRVSVPLEDGPPGAMLHLQLSVDAWMYQQALPSMLKTPGPRSVVLQVMEGRDLSSRDWGGMSDPYVKIMYGGTTHRTRAIYNTIHPVWASTFTFPELVHQLTRHVRLEVWDSGIANDEMLGAATFNIDMLHENTVQDAWLQLSGAETGDVRIRMALVPGGPESDAAHTMTELLASSLAHAAGDTLQVVVVSARNLSSRSNLMVQRNAYVNITYQGARQVTPFAKVVNNPVWNFPVMFPMERTARPASSSGGSSSYEDTEVLQLSVMDLNSVPGDDEMGSVNLVVPSLLQSPGSVWENWVPLKKGGGTSAAGPELLVRLTYLAPTSVYHGPMRLPWAVAEGPTSLDSTSEQRTPLPMDSTGDEFYMDANPPIPGAPTEGLNDAPTSPFKRIKVPSAGELQRSTDFVRGKVRQEWIPMVKDLFKSIAANPWGGVNKQRKNNIGGDSMDEDDGSGGDTPRTRLPHSVDATLPTPSIDNPASATSGRSAVGPVPGSSSSTPGSTTGNNAQDAYRFLSDNVSAAVAATRNMIGNVGAKAQDDVTALTGAVANAVSGDTEDAEAAAGRGGGRRRRGGGGGGGGAAAETVISLSSAEDIPPTILSSTSGSDDEPPPVVPVSDVLAEAAHESAKEAALKDVAAKTNGRAPLETSEAAVAAVDTTAAEEKLVADVLTGEQQDERVFTVAAHEDAAAVPPLRK